MGTIINGNKWSGACVNGKVVSGLVKNGVVFYKKQLIDLYKRRVMVGDNLRNKVVYGDFKMGYYVTLMNADEEDSITCNNNHLDTVYEYITSDYCSVDNNMRDSSSNLSLYEYDATNGTEILNNNSLIKNDKDYIVSEIIDNATYRHLFIKDPNIRPVQVGDIIVKGTKLYFNFPDNLTNIEDKTIFSLDTMEDLYSKISSNKIYITDRIEPLLKSPVSTLSVEPTEEGAVVMKKIFDTEDSLNIINLSTYTYECHGYQEGIPVNEIDNELINYVLVDVTTLGN